MHWACGGCGAYGAAGEVLADGFSGDGPAGVEDAGHDWGVGLRGPVCYCGCAEEAGDVRDADVVF